MKWFFGSLILVFIIAIGFLILYKPSAKPSDIPVESMRSAINDVRVSAGVGLVYDNAKLDAIVADAINQVAGQRLAGGLAPNITVKYGTNSTSFVLSKSPLGAVGYNTKEAVIGYWESSPEFKAVLLDPSFNIYGVATGKSRDGLNVVFAIFAHCTADC